MICSPSLPFNYSSLSSLSLAFVPSSCSPPSCLTRFTTCIKVGWSGETKPSLLSFSSPSFLFSTTAIIPITPSSSIIFIFCFSLIPVLLPFLHFSSLTSPISYLPTLFLFISFSLLHYLLLPFSLLFLFFPPLSTYLLLSPDQ
uniref:Uncharacterized protein n=1 Tax=Cacopsylla melanoneura TaxID=428564 RepID=A0A8D8Z4U0_9HEMI